MTKKLWFKRKSYGWGWVPVTWQGWTILAIWFIPFYFTIKSFDHEWLKNLAITILLTALLIAICYLTGESPRWQWGYKSKHHV